MPHFNCRSATNGPWGRAIRGLKPTATIMGSLRDRGRAITEIHEELAGLNTEAVELAATIQKNLEELGV